MPVHESSVLGVVLCRGVLVGGGCMGDTSSNSAVLRRFFLFNFWILFGVILFVARGDKPFVAFSFLLLAAAGYAFIYLAPAWLLSRLVLILPGGRMPAFLLACLLSAATLFLLYLDGFIYHLYGFHLNGFVWNLLTTPGGIESMGGSDGTEIAVAVIAVALVALQAGLFWLARMSLQRGTLQWLPRARWAVLALFLVMVAERGAYGVSHYTAYRPVLLAAQHVPFYIPTTFRGFAKKIGLKPGRNVSLSTVEGGKLNYPKAPLLLADGARPWNIVWIACESLRADMLTPEIMPNLWRFAERGRRFTNHISGGNGTRMGVFSMFYGLPGSYWFSFMDERRSPVLIDMLQQRDYQFGIYTSAKFTYPEFDKTVWAGMPQEFLHADDAGVGWERDRRNAGRMIEFIEGADRNKPFMSFMFFESAHARYYFPPENEIRKDFLADFNYATVDIEENIDKIFNRYINAANHLDGQIGRVITSLEQQGLLDSTLIVITGDHGEEFMERGRWGHNSEFHNEQINTPLVLLAPGVSPAVIDAPTSHVDLAPTVMSLLGVVNPASDYSTGVNLLDPIPNRYRLVASWDALGYVGSDYKVAMPLAAGGVFEMAVSTADDMPVDDESAVMALLQPKMADVLNDMSAFYRK
jgi:membrane-anchored protein YejM (alkaline phosphatase superfamily)